MKTKSVREKCLEFITKSAAPVSNRDISEKLKIKPSTVATSTGAMWQAGVLKRSEQGSVGLVKKYAYFLAEANQGEAQAEAEATIPEEAELEAAIEMFVRALAARIFGEVRADIRDRLK